jgi:hypothetical protein
VGAADLVDQAVEDFGGLLVLYDAVVVANDTLLDGTEGADEFGLVRC